MDRLLRRAAAHQNGLQLDRGVQDLVCRRTGRVAKATVDPPEFHEGKTKLEWILSRERIREDKPLAETSRYLWGCRSLGRARPAPRARGSAGRSGTERGLCPGQGRLGEARAAHLNTSNEPTAASTTNAHGWSISQGPTSAGWNASS